MKTKIKEYLIEIKDNYLLVVFFILSNLINSIIIRIITVKTFNISPLVIDLGFLIIISLFSLILKRKNRIKYFFCISIILNLVCIINSIYYNYYNSFASLSLLATAAFAADVSDAIIDTVLKPIDLIYLWQPFVLYIFYFLLKKRNYFKFDLKQKSKIILKTGGLSAIILFLIGSVFMPINAWGRLYKLWNRESVVINFGIYTYQLDDFIQSLTPRITSLLGYDKALNETKKYYEENKYIKVQNEYTDIFKGKNVIVIHAESMQTFAMNLNFNNKEVTPNLNKIANEGIFFNNFYSEVGVGTSSDAEFTFNTSLMPSTKGTVFVNYFDRKYVATPELLNKKGYYTFSMHANTGEFWNRNVMHKNLGYNKFYSKDSYNIDETIGLGLSDRSFFNQSINIIKNIKEEEEPYYGVLIMLSNHTPFNDFNIIDEYPTTIDVKVNNQIITRDYLNNTQMGNYLRTIHYADEALGEFINNLDKENLLENTVLIIYGDHDARLPFNDFNLLYNYDPITDTVRTEENENYIPYNKYNYELDRKVPLIIWTKDSKFNKEVNTPMGMIDVLPTIGNMLGIHSKYQLGKDIFNIKDNDNTVTFIDGSFLTSKIYYNSPKGEIYSINNDPITEEYVKNNAEESTKKIEISNNIITYDLIKELDDKSYSALKGRTK